MTTAISSSNSPFYKELVGNVDEHILHLRDSRGVLLLDKLNELPVKYFLNRCLGTPWQNQLLLAMFISGDRNLDAQTVFSNIGHVNVRLKDIFQAYDLKTFTDFDTEKHMYDYFKSLIYPEHSNSQRAEFFRRYKSISYLSKKWLTSKLSEEQQEYFQQFLLPLPRYDSRDFIFNKQTREQAQNTRKSETDAIVPYLPQIRAEANFRWNQMKRLREAFLISCKRAEQKNVTLPLEFHYDEPERIGERFYFRLWDKPSFVLYHKEKFTESIVKSAEMYLSIENRFFPKLVEILKICPYCSYYLSLGMVL
ncbi:hypothetical protein [Bacillus cereus]